jgi:hypothetical protein
LFDFFYISGDDLYEKIWPLKEILSKDLINQLTKFHFAKESNPPKSALSQRDPQKFNNSVIIKFQQAELLANWIGRNDDTIKRKLGISYEFQLLLRGSRDGMDMRTFHKLCDNKGPTLIIIKTIGLDKIIGGYNPLSWMSSRKFQITTESFIFSLGIKKNSHLLSRVQNSNRAIRDFAHQSPGFSDDLVFFNGTYKKISYEKYILDTNSFDMEDYEVFQVIKK